MTSSAVCLALGLTFALPIPAVTRQIPDQRNGDKTSSSNKAESVSAPAVEVINGTSRVITDFNTNSKMARSAAAVRRHGGTASAGTSVVVINGSMERTVVLKAEPSPTSVRNTARRNTAKHLGWKRSATAHRRLPEDKIPMNQKHATSIETPMAEGSAPVTDRNLPPNVIGIESSDSRNLRGKSKLVVVGILSSGSASRASNAQPVVVGIASSASQGPGGNAQQVVIGVSASGAQAAGTVKPVAVGVAPRPAKRRPYRPAALDAQ
jgi:hypothetical protein